KGRPVQAAESDRITAADVLAALEAQGTTVTEGDILLLRTGWLTWYRSLDAAARAERAATPISAACGLDPGEASPALLWDLHIAAVAADNPALEVLPFGGITDIAGMVAAMGDPE